jgi:hypothetical protein
MHMQQKKAAIANIATVVVSARDVAGASAAMPAGGRKPCGHRSHGRVSASATSIAQPISTNAHRQPKALMARLAKNGSRPCPAAPPAVTIPITSPRRSGNHSPLVDNSGEYSTEKPSPP